MIPIEILLNHFIILKQCHKEAISQLLFSRVWDTFQQSFSLSLIAKSDWEIKKYDLVENRIDI